MVIAKIKKGKQFNPTLKYLLDESKSPYIIGGKVIGDSVEDLNWEFLKIAQLRPTTEKPVRHFSLAFAPEDGKVDFLTKLDVAERFLQLMGDQPTSGNPKKGNYGYYDNQYLIVSHGREDPAHPKEHDHDHIHILANAITFDGERIPDHHDYYQARAACRKIEKEFGLTQVSNEAESSNQITIPHLHEQRLKRESEEYQSGKRSSQPEPYYKAELQDIINDATADQPQLSVFYERLKAQGVEPHPYRTEKGRQRISYSYKGFHFRGSSLKNASFPKLLKKRGLKQDNDQQKQSRGTEEAKITPTPSPQQEQPQPQSEEADPEKIASLLMNLLKETGENQIGVNYADQKQTIQYHDNTLYYGNNDETLFQATVNANNQWQIKINNLNKTDEQYLAKEAPEIIEKLNRQPPKQKQLKMQNQQQMEL